VRAGFLLRGWVELAWFRKGNSVMVKKSEYSNLVLLAIGTL